MAETRTTVSVDGHRLRLTNLDKVLYPETGTTKAEVLDYYSRIAPVLIPHARDRPVTRKRWVSGVGTAEHPGQVFFQKNLEDSAPSWVPRHAITHSDHVNVYPMVNDLATLTWLAQIASLELHVPQWRFGPRGARRNPDRLVLDLDPGEGAGLAECVEVALLARAILRDMGLDPMPVTSGSKGIHLYAALDGRQSSQAVTDVAHELARALEADHPDLVVSDMKKTLRRGKVLVDWSQNNGNKTTIVPYSLRGRSRPTVAAPRTWRELASKSLRQLEFPEVLERVRRRGDPLAAMSAGTAEGSGEPREGAPAQDRLSTYRSMRDASKTPEPVPEASPRDSGGRSFVIQEHHARRLHWDFRLEHDGVLVSWALPKGPPTDPKRNHLAVHTEDHPIEYGSFEGTIPAGEYGAGTVSIWDSGTYELEKWRDDEVIATLHSRRRGTRRYALIRTGGSGGRAENNWLIHLMKPRAEGAGATPSDPPTAGSGGGRDAEAVPDPTEADAAEAHLEGRTATSRRANLRPMLATLGSAADFSEHLEDRDDWAWEMKWDGIRALAAVDEHGRITIRSRNGIEISARYPELAQLTTAVAGPAVLDGEIVALDRSGRPSFGLLQTRMGLTAPREIEAARASAPVRYVVFDVLEAEGESLTRRSYDRRRETLARVLTEGDRILLSPEIPGSLRSALESSAELGLEGVIAKRRASRYEEGKRSSSWVKIKFHRAQEVVVVGWKEGQGGRSGRVGSLALAIPDPEGRLTYVGRVGTGFRARDLEEMGRRFERLARKTPPVDDVPAADARGLHWIRPSLVAEVEYAEITPTGRLRQPSWRGWRPDKAPEDVRWELPGR